MYRCICILCGLQSLGPFVFAIDQWQGMRGVHSRVGSVAAKGLTPVHKLGCGLHAKGSACFHLSFPHSICVRHNEVRESGRDCKVQLTRTCVWVSLGLNATGNGFSALPLPPMTETATYHLLAIPRVSSRSVDRFKQLVNVGARVSFFL